MAEQYCPAFGPGSAVCPRSICDCFIEEFPDDMALAGAIHPEFYRIVGCAHEDFATLNLGGGASRHTCLDCGASTVVTRDPH